MRSMNNDENKNALKNLFRPISVPPDIQRPASAIQADLDDARRSSRYERQLVSRMKQNYSVPKDRLGNKHNRQSQKVEPGEQ